MKFDLLITIIELLHFLNNTYFKNYLAKFDIDRTILIVGKPCSQNYSKTLKNMLAIWS